MVTDEKMARLMFTAIEVVAVRLPADLTAQVNRRLDGATHREIANMSYSATIFPLELKQGRVTPSLKKPGHDQLDLATYRAIMNLSTRSKVLECLAVRQLRPPS